MFGRPDEDPLNVQVKSTTHQEEYTTTSWDFPNKDVPAKIDVGEYMFQYVCALVAPDVPQQELLAIKPMFAHLQFAWDLIPTMNHRLVADVLPGLLSDAAREAIALTDLGNLLDDQMRMKQALHKQSLVAAFGLQKHVDLYGKIQTLGRTRSHQCFENTFLASPFFSEEKRIWEFIQVNEIQLQYGLPADLFTPERILTYRRNTGKQDIAGMIRTYDAFRQKYADANSYTPNNIRNLYECLRRNAPELVVSTGDLVHV